MSQTKPDEQLPEVILPEEPEQKSEEEKKKDLKKKAAKAGVAVITSASVLVGGLFSSPDVLLADEQPLNPVAITQNNNDNDLDGDSDDDSSQDEEEEEESAGESVGLRASLQQKILRLPMTVRVFVLIPLWALGWAIWTVATGLWSMLLGPIAGKAVSWLFLLGALLGAFVLGAKTLFPDLPIKKIVNKKSILGIVIGGLVLGIADLTVPLFWDGYEALAKGFRAVGMALILGTALFALLHRVVKKHRAEPAPAAGPAPAAEPEHRLLTNEEILAIADSVGRKR